MRHLRSTHYRGVTIPSAVTATACLLAVIVLLLNIDYAQVFGLCAVAAWGRNHGHR